MIKCKKCKHYYRMMTTEGGGYNPAPCCHLLEDKNKRPNILTQECFEPRKKSKKKRV